MPVRTKKNLLQWFHHLDFLTLNLSLFRMWGGGTAGVGKTRSISREKFAWNKSTNRVQTSEYLSSWSPGIQPSVCLNSAFTIYSTPCAPFFPNSKRFCEGNALNFLSDKEPEVSCHMNQNIPPIFSPSSLCSVSSIQMMIPFPITWQGLGVGKEGRRGTKAKPNTICPVCRKAQPFLSFGKYLAYRCLQLHSEQPDFYELFNLALVVRLPFCRTW